MARCLRNVNSKGGYLLLWMQFLEDFANGRAGPNDNPDRLPHKTAKKANADLRAGIDRDALNTEHNAEVMRQHQELKAESKARKQARREEEDGQARAALKKRRTSTKANTASPGRELDASDAAVNSDSLSLQADAAKVLSHT